MTMRSRSADLVDHQQLKHTHVAIIGLGAIGSNVAYVLSKMGVGYIWGYDADVVGEENIEPQVYRGPDVGKGKAAALGWYLTPPSEYYVIPEWWEKDTVVPAPNTIVIGAVDSMESRQDIVASLIKGPGANRWTHYIDGRMGGNIIQVYHATPETIRDYYQESVAGVTPMELLCSETAIAYNGLMCATYIARMVASILNGQPYPEYIKVDLLAWSHEVDLQL